MRLLSQTSRKYEAKEGIKNYEKFWIVIPSKLVEKLKWKTGDDLEAEVKGDKLVIEKD
jgi:AbrB family looped-hinge helix DNA binding protein